MTPFTYPSAPIVRRHDPIGYLDYDSFRPWLRDEFRFRCVYCLRRERWEPDLGVFEIDRKGSGVKLIELAAGVTLEEITAKTEAGFIVAIER